MKGVGSLLVWLACGCSGIAQTAPVHGMTALELAASVLDGLRDDKHRKEIGIQWPDATDHSVPDDFDVFWIDGYMCYTGTRIHRSNGGVLIGEKVVAKRSWFYNSDGESIVSQRWEIDPTRFARVWAAARLVLDASAVELNPRLAIRGEGDGDGEEEPMSIRQAVSSHESYHWIAWSVAKENSSILEKCIRGQSYRDDIRDFTELQICAIRKLFGELVPETASASPLRDWSDYFEKQLRLRLSRLSVPLEDESLVIPYKCGLRVMGEAGRETAGELAGRIAEQFKGITWRQDFDSYSMHEEAEMAGIRIGLRLAWSPEKATEMIHTLLRENNGRDDLVKWIRLRYFQNDSDAYFRLLVSDLDAKDSQLLAETIADLSSRYPGKAASKIRGLLDISNPEIAVAAASAMLAVDPSDATALEALNRIASDPSVPTPARARSFYDYGRRLALEKLCDKRVPVGRRWDAKRVREQINKPGEDGRMILSLIRRADRLLAPLSREEEIAALHRALDVPPSRAWVEVCERLIELKDKSSLALIRERVKTLAAGRHRYSFEDDAPVIYPWVDKYDLDPLLIRAESLEKGD